VGLTGLDVVVIVVAALAEPVVLVVVLAGLVKRGHLTATLHKQGIRRQTRRNRSAELTAGLSGR
jgi:hypothetical protein